MVASKEELMVAFHRGWEAVGVLTIEAANKEFEQWFEQWMRYKTRVGPGKPYAGTYAGYDLLPTGEKIPPPSESFRHVDGTWRTPPDTDLIAALEEDRDDWHRRYLVALNQERRTLESKEGLLRKVQEARMEAARLQGSLDAVTEDRDEYFAWSVKEIKRLRRLVTRLGGEWRVKKAKRG